MNTNAYDSPAINAINIINKMVLNHKNLVYDAGIRICRLGSRNVFCAKVNEFLKVFLFSVLITMNATTNGMHIVKKVSNTQVILNLSNFVNSYINTPTANDNNQNIVYAN